MTDKEIRTELLQYLYDIKDTPRPEDSLEDKARELGITKYTLYRVLIHLREKGLVNGLDVAPRDFSAKREMIDIEISADGVDVVEGNALPPLAVNFNTNSYHLRSVSGTAIQIGSGNSQTFENQLYELAQAINNAPITDEEKRGLKTRLADFLSHPATQFVVPKAGDLLSLLA